jgi:hypothetical protein
METLIKSWTGSGGNYCELYAGYFLIGKYNGPWANNAGQCSYEEFLAGTYQKDVLSLFGQDVLKEITALMK